MDAVIFGLMVFGPAVAGLAALIGAIVVACGVPALRARVAAGTATRRTLSVRYVLIGILAVVAFGVGSCYAVILTTSFY